ncbi:ABC transporter permease [Leucobacter sp. Psy1]|uniref:zinc ABC transporter permease AztB n=1 Tax=Leucobacter sp. Psy1 TaxID=2875729 RepID=UPI001CD6EB54|nr:zinc ABC transporter permease AztB [Leucobacter sp. Psy1]UBH05370.1 ABC transporter permease [Leucobacter sp. Psy1]
MPVFLEPFATEFFTRALFGGSLVAVICGVVGTWVVIRGMAFLGEAIGHGMLPGVALATILGLPLLLGAAVSAIVMSGAIGVLQRRGRLSYDTSIGLLFVAMLSLGVIIVSHSRSFATDATALLFGDILAIGSTDIVLLCVALVVTLAVTTAMHRSFVATAFDRRLSQVLGLRPQLAHLALVGLVTLAVVASFQAVGTLLVVGLLIAPAVAARAWTVRIPTAMALSAVTGVLAVTSGLLVSWHAGTAAGASIAGSAILFALCSSTARALFERTFRRPTPTIPLTKGPHEPVEVTDRAPADGHLHRTSGVLHSTRAGR